MSEAVIVALITGGLSLIGIIITSVKSNQQLFAKLDKQSELSDAKLDAKLEKHQAVTDTKIEELTRKVERHNNMIERTYQLEGRMNEAEHDIKDLKGRIA
jgi:ferritin-like metal-binding protein YciE